MDLIIETLFQALNAGRAWGKLTEVGQVHGKGMGAWFLLSNSSLEAWELLLSHVWSSSCGDRSGTSSFLKASVVTQISILRRLFALGQCFLNCQISPMRTVYSGSDLIWSAEFSWVWGVFLTLGLLFVVLNILFRSPLHKTGSRKHRCLLLLPCVSPIVLGKP